MMRKTMMLFVCFSLFLVESAFAAPDSVVIPGELRITGAGNGLVFPNGSIQTEAAAPWPHSHFEAYWTGTSQSYGLEVDNSAGTGDGIRGYSGSTLPNFAGVYGLNTATSGYGTGIYGYSNKGVGVYAGSEDGDGLEATTNSTTKSAIYAHAANANGVWAVSSNKQAVHGGSTSDVGVEGVSTNSYGGYFTSDTYHALYASSGPGRYAADFENSGGSNEPGLYVDGVMWVTGAKVGFVTDAAINDGPELLETGDVVVITGAAKPIAGETPVIRVRKATTAGSTAVAGVVDQGVVMQQGAKDKQAIPGVVGHEAHIADNTAIQPGGYLLIVTLGAYKGVKVDATLAPIHAGDHLVASGGAGYAASSADPKFSTVIGKALGELKSGTGLIPVLVTLK